MKRSDQVGMKFDEKLIGVALALFVIISLTFYLTSITIGQLIYKARIPNREIFNMSLSYLGDPLDPNKAFTDMTKLHPHYSYAFNITFFGFIFTLLFIFIKIYLHYLSEKHNTGGKGREVNMLNRDARWARISDIKSLIVKDVTKSRIILGTFGWRGNSKISFLTNRLSYLNSKTKSNTLLACETRQSLLVIGPTQSRKTSGFAIPAILEWEGPVIATSVKSDLLLNTKEWRSSKGPTWIVDPSELTGEVSSAWSPIDSSHTWPEAKRVARNLAMLSAPLNNGIEDAQFWYAMAAKLLAPLFFAAAYSSKPIREVIRWLDLQDQYEPIKILGLAGVNEALQSAEASFKREERQRSSIYTTAEAILEPFSEDSSTKALDPNEFINSSGTVYLCSPAHEQSRLMPYFSSVITTVLNCAYDQVARSKIPLDPPLLVILDEAAHIAALPNLDALAATSASQGIQIVSVFQDLSQLNARYGSRAATVVNNHKTKIVLSGISDPETLDHISNLIGETKYAINSLTQDRSGNSSITKGHEYRKLASSSGFRSIPPGCAVAIHGPLPPIPLTLRPFFEDRVLSKMASYIST